MNNHPIIDSLVNLVISLICAGLIWGYYQKETVSPDLRYSTFAPRFWTGWVDSCVLWPVGFLATLLYTFELPRVAMALLLVAQSMAWLLYTVLMHARSGQTIGKRVTKVRVVDAVSEQQITYTQAWVREGIPMLLTLGVLGYEVCQILNGAILPPYQKGEDIKLNGHFGLLAALPAIWYFAEVLTMLTNSKRRALHDFIAGTVVIRTNVEESLPGTNVPTPSLTS
jgi:uncharacterized RDD family membrane protein YckC